MPSSRELSPDSNPRKIAPVFLQALFRFESPSQIPHHYEGVPLTPNFVGLWALFGWSREDGVLNFAVDVVSQEQARLLAEAKARHQESTLELYGYTMDVYILDPDGNSARCYQGRSN